MNQSYTFGWIQHDSFRDQIVSCGRIIRYNFDTAAMNLPLMMMEMVSPNMMVIAMTQSLLPTHLLQNTKLFSMMLTWMAMLGSSTPPSGIAQDETVMTMMRHDIG